VVKEIGKTFDRGAPSEEERLTVREQHWDFQRNLNGDILIANPFQSVLAEHMPVGRTGVIRLFRHFLQLIRVVTYLHQFQRTPEEDGVYLSTLEDCAIARELVLGPLNHILGVVED